MLKCDLVKSNGLNCCLCNELSISGRLILIRISQFRVLNDYLIFITVVVKEF